MKHLILVVSLLLCLATAGCGRGEPAGPTTPPTTTLQPIAQYSLAPHVAEPSGIVYNPVHNTFLVVSDSHPFVYEVDFQGRLLSTITTTCSDLEGVGLSPHGDSLFVAEERLRRISIHRIDGSLLGSFLKDVATLANNGLEGVSVGPDGLVYVLNEKAPGMIIVCRPDGTELRRITLNLASDYSDLMVDADRGCLWIISDESRKVMKTDMSGNLLAEWNVPFAKGEGISIVRDTMYVVNDADAKMYVFPLPG